MGPLGISYLLGNLERALGVVFLLQQTECFSKRVTTFFKQFDPGIELSRNRTNVFF